MPDELKPKKRPARRRVAVAAAADSPAPADIASSGGPMCGHEGPACNGGTCGVRYVGPTTHMRDHHVVHAARGVSHVWTAAIVSGLAVVLTGAVAWTAVDAEVRKPTVQNQVNADSAKLIMKRLDDLERLMKDTKAACGPAGMNQQVMQDKPVEKKVVKPLPKPDSTSTQTGTNQ